MASLQRKALNDLIAGYRRNLPIFEKIRELLVSDINNSKALSPLLHSTKSRVKDPSHLRAKIIRKQSKYFSRRGILNLNDDNLPFTINDLVGVRLMHLYTRQFEEINEHLLACLHENRYILREGPTARVWDHEQKAYYESIGIDTVDSPNLYSSVHYVISTKDDKKGATAEIQVRTLADELWGEVDHLINYPKQSRSKVCREQIAVLARLTSGVSRLTDSIFLSEIESKPR